MRARLLAYAIVVAAAAAAVAGGLYLGEQRYPVEPAPAAIARPAAPPAAAGPLGPLALLLAQLLTIVVTTRAGGRLARRFRQPAVVGEIGAGLLLGPSLLGALWPGASAALFPEPSLGVLGLLSQLGVILFMFGVGLDLDAAHLRRTAPTAVAVSHVGIVVPFVLGVGAALHLFPAHGPPGVPFHAFALFMGVALSITAFPVLARILEERRLMRTPVGATALACAAVDDVTAWVLLAVVVTLVTSGGAAATVGGMAVALAAFLAVALGVVRPWLARTVGHGDTYTARALVVLLASALATEAIGIHALFGAFVAGTLLPPDAELRRRLRARLHAVTSIVLLPAFFAFTGLRTEVGLLDASSWVTCLAVVGVATLGKLGGSLAAARWTGAAWRDAFALGALMNTRGLMELVALNVGYELGVLSPRMFTILVVMALVTTAMTGPLLDAARQAPAAGDIGLGDTADDDRPELLPNR